MEPSYWWFWMQSTRTQSLLISPTGRFALICGSLESLKPRQAYDRAIGLADNPAVREFLLQKRGLIFSRPCRNNPTSPVTTIEAA